MNTIKSIWDGRQHIDLSPPGAMDFAAAFCLTTLATLLNLLAWPMGSDADGHYFALAAAVLISALYGGLWLGLAATMLAGLSSAYFHLSPQYSIAVASPHATGRLMLFLAEGGLLSVIAFVVRSQDLVDVHKVRLGRYLAIPIAVGAATVIKLMLPDFVRELPFSFNYAAVCICSWAGGFVSGLVATVLLAGFTKFLFLEPLYSLSVADHAEGIRVALFVGEGILVSALGGAYANVKGIAGSFLALMRAQTETARRLHQDTETIRAISRDTIWEWEIDTGEITRTASSSGALADVLPAQEGFDSWLDRIHPADRDATISRLQRAIEEGRQELQYSYRLRSPDGKFLSIADHAFIVRGDDWKPLRVIGRSAALPMPNGQKS